MSGLKLEGVAVSLGGTPILGDVSFEIKPGEVLGLIGPNGAGKSTALRAILGLVEAGGDITLDGNSVKGMSAKERARQIAYVPQGAPVHWPLTAERTVALGRIPHLTPWQDMSSADNAAIEQAMRQTDCWEFRDRLVTTLSGGERARVLLARTIAVGAGYMLADEPTASLDPEHQLQVMDVLRAEASRGVGVVIVMHDLSLAMRSCDKLVLLHDGRVLAAGKPGDVLTDEHVATAFNVKMAKWNDGTSDYLVPHQTLGG